MTARKLFRGLSTNRMGTTSWTGDFGNFWIQMSVSLTPVLIGQKRRKGGITGKPLMNSGIKNSVWHEKKWRLPNHSESRHGRKTVMRNTIFYDSSGHIPFTTNAGRNV